MSTNALKPEQALATLPNLTLYINGQWVESDTKEQIEVANPATGKPLAKVPHASAAAVDRAVYAARGAWDAWR